MQPDVTIKSFGPGTVLAKRVGQAPDRQFSINRAAAAAKARYTS